MSIVCLGGGRILFHTRFVWEIGVLIYHTNGLFRGWAYFITRMVCLVHMIFYLSHELLVWGIGLFYFITRLVCLGDRRILSHD